MPSRSLARAESSATVKNLITTAVNLRRRSRYPMSRRLLSFPDSRLCSSLLALALLGAGSPLLSQQPDAIEAALKQPILSPGQAEKEVSDYCEARVPRMPEIGSRSEWRRTAEKLRKETLKRAVY